MNALTPIDEAVTVRLCVDAVRNQWSTHRLPPGATLAEIHDGLELPYEGVRGLLGVRVGHVGFPREDWPHVRPRAGSLVVFAPEIGGPLFAAIGAGFSALSTAAGSMFGAGGFSAFLKTGVGSLLKGIVLTGASMLLQGLLRPKTPDAEAPETTRFAGAQNDFKPGAYFKLWMGEFKDTLQVTVPPFTEIDGDDQLATIGLTAVGKFTAPILYAGDVEITTVQDREVVIWEASAGEAPPAEVLALVTGTKVERGGLGITLTNWETDPDDTEDGATDLDGTVEETEPLWHPVESLRDFEFFRVEFIFDQMFHIDAAAGGGGDKTAVPLRFRIAFRDGATWGSWIDGPVIIVGAREQSKAVRIQLFVHKVAAYPAEVGNAWPGTAGGTPFEEVSGWDDIFIPTGESSPLLTAVGDGYTQWWWENEQKLHLYLLNSAYPEARMKMEFKRSWPMLWINWSHASKEYTFDGSTTDDLFSPFPTATTVPGNPRNFMDSGKINSVQNYWPVFSIAPKGNVKTHIFIRVRNQEIGVIKAQWTRLIDDWNGSAWIADQPSNSPASLYRTVLKGVHNAKPVPDGLIDGPAMIDFYDWCATADKSCRMTLPGGGSVIDALKMIALTGFARPVFAPLHSVIIDRPRMDGPVGLITSRSAAGFNWEKPFAEKPHAIDASYMDAESDYETRSVRVYAHGYNADGSGGLIEATRFQAETYPGIVFENDVILRAELNLAWIWYRDRPVYCTQALAAREHEQGDLVLVETEVLGRQSGRGRIKSFTASGGDGGLREIANLRDVHDLRDVRAGPVLVSAIVIDEAPFFGEASLDLRAIPDLRLVDDLRGPAPKGIAIRERTGDVSVHEVASYSTETNEIVLVTPVNLDIAEGDEVATGPLGMEARKMLVWDIVPRGRRRSQLMLLPYAEEGVYFEGALPEGAEQITYEGEAVMYGGRYIWHVAA